MAIIRKYRLHHSLANAPLTLVYSAVMAATAVSFALDGTTEEQASVLSQPESYMAFLLKAFKEFSAVYGVAADACTRLEVALEGTAQQQPAAEGAQHNYDGSGNGDAGTLFEGLNWAEFSASWNSLVGSSDALVPALADDATATAPDAEHHLFPLGMD